MPSKRASLCCLQCFLVWLFVLKSNLLFTDLKEAHSPTSHVVVTHFCLESTPLAHQPVILRSLKTVLHCLNWNHVFFQFDFTWDAAMVFIEDQILVSTGNNLKVIIYNNLFVKHVAKHLFFRLSIH